MCKTEDCLSELNKRDLFGVVTDVNLDFVRVMIVVGEQGNLYSQISADWFLDKNHCSIMTKY